MVIRFFNLDFHYCIQNSRPLVHILIKMNPIIILPFRFKIILIWSSHLRLGLLIFLSSCFFIHSFSDNTFNQPLQCPFQSLHMHTCCDDLSAVLHKYTVMLKVCINMFCLYVRILSVSSAATAISTPFILSYAVLCLNMFLIILIISHYPSTRKLCKLLRVLKKHV